MLAPVVAVSRILGIARRRMWFAVCVVLGASIVLHGLYNNYSGAYVHTGVAVAAVLAGVFRPTLGVAVGLAWLLASLVGQAMIPDVSYFGADVRPGMPRSEIRGRLGAPEMVISSQPEMANLRVGYAKPSPWRYRQIGPVEVYVRGEWALWIFYSEAGFVVYSFIGGS